MLKDFNESFNDWTLNTEFFGNLSLDHSLDDLHINWNVDSRTIKLVEVVHGF